MSTTTADNPGHAHDAAHGAHGAHGADGHGHHGPAHLAHHFDTPEQQFTTGKLGMWTFLATEVLMFGGLFCAYAVYRYNHPEVYLWAHRALDPFWGMVNTIVLLASSFTMAWGVRAAQLGQRSLLQLMLVLTFVGGVVFMCVKAVEYKQKWEHHLFPGHLNALSPAFNPGKDANAADIREHTIATVESHGQESHVGDAGGHGPDHSAGGPSEGHEKSNAASSGNQHVSPTNAHSTTNPNAAASANVHQPATSQPVGSPTGQMAAYTEIGHTTHDVLARTPDVANIRPPTLIPAGINEAADHPPEHHWTTYAEMEPTDRAQLTTFFSIYFMMTGLHGIHVLVGMGIIAWLYVKAGTGVFTGGYYTPVDLGGLYWHLVDLIWIFLFPLLYLIH